MLFFEIYANYIILFNHILIIVTGHITRSYIIEI